MKTEVVQERENLGSWLDLMKTEVVQERVSHQIPDLASYFEHSFSNQEY